MQFEGEPTLEQMCLAPRMLMWHHGFPFPRFHPHSSSAVETGVQKHEISNKMNTEEADMAYGASIRTATTACPGCSPLL